MANTELVHALLGLGTSQCLVPTKQRDISFKTTPKIVKTIDAKCHTTCNATSLQRGLLDGLIVAGLSLLPVHNIPPLLEVGGLVVLVLQVPRVFPNVATEDRVVRHKRVLVFRGHNFKVTTLAETKPAPA